MKKVLRVLLALALPFSANAANICLQDSSTGYIVKFKKPAVAKLGAATIAGTLIVPAELTPVAHPQFLGSVSGNVVALGNGTLTYSIMGGVFYTSDLVAAQEAGYEAGYISYQVTNASVKTYIGLAQDFSALDGIKTASLVAIDCKTVPVY